jgi:hypothetical protein
MTSKRALIPNKPRRLPKSGFLFTLARFAGLLLKIGGLLLLAIALIGFFILLVRLAPTLVESLRHLDQEMAGFVLLVSLGSLLAFPIIGLVAVAITGIGFALGLVGTQPRVDIDIQVEGAADKKEGESSGEADIENGKT